MSLYDGWEWTRSMIELTDRWAVFVQHPYNSRSGPFFRIEFFPNKDAVIVYGPFGNRALALKQDQPVALRVGLEKARVAPGFHRCLPWSDMYDDGEVDWDALSLAITIDAPDEPLLSGSFDLIEDVPIDSGYIRHRWNDEALRRWELALQVLGGSYRRSQA